jgi:hypothetical protein
MAKRKYIVPKLVDIEDTAEILLDPPKVSKTELREHWEEVAPGPSHFQGKVVSGLKDIAGVLGISKRQLYRLNKNEALGEEGIMWKDDGCYKARLLDLVIYSWTRKKKTQ